MQDKTIFFSDLHIDRWNRDRKDAFLDFMKYVEKEASEVYVLGDIFDFPALKGDSVWPRHEEVVMRLRRLAKKNIALTYLIGNHDISLRGIEFSEKNFRITYCDNKNPILKKIAGRTVYMEHGHYYDPLFQDHIYEAVDFLKSLTGQAVDVKAVDFLRDIVRIMQRNPKKKPAEIARKHDEKEFGVPEKFLKIWETEAEQILKRTRCNIVMFGHTHAPLISRMLTKDQFYVNTGDWFAHSTFVELTPKSLKLKDWLTDSTLDKIKF
jgi:UDP-2,3-diacylglucosamine hydrolase